MPILALLLAIFCNIVWSLNPVIGKKLLLLHSPIQVAFLRYFSAALFTWLALPFFYKAKKTFSLPQKQSKILIGLLGLITFFFSPLLQYEGLNFSFATDNAVLIGLEPIATVLLARFFLKEKIKIKHILSFLFAVPGIFFLSEVTVSDFASSSLHLLGNLLIILSLFCEGAFSSIVKVLGTRLSAYQIYFFGSSFGLLLLLLFTFLKSGLPSISLKELPLLLWIGPIGTSITYFIWTFLLTKGISIPILAITLFLQPVLGCIWGIFFLGETLSQLQFVGIFLIFSAILLHGIKFSARK